MYRQYENPFFLNERIAFLKKEYKKTKDFYIHEEIEELEERLNFAYQDEEF